MKLITLRLLFLLLAALTAAAPFFWVSNLGAADVLPLPSLAYIYAPVFFISPCLLACGLLPLKHLNAIRWAIPMSLAAALLAGLSYSGAAANGVIAIAIFTLPAYVFGLWALRGRRPNPSFQGTRYTSVN